MNNKGRNTISKSLKNTFSTSITIEESEDARYELLESHEPDNAGAGKSNLPGNPIEQYAIKKFSDNRYNT